MITFTRMDSTSSYRGAVTTVPEWARVNEISRLFSIGRSTLYQLIRTGAVASRVVKTSKYNVSGIRIINIESVRAFIESQPSIVEDEKAGAA